MKKIEIIDRLLALHNKTKQIDDAIADEIGDIIGEISMNMFSIDQLAKDASELAEVDEKERVRNIRVSEIDMSTRLRNVLKQTQFFSYSDLFPQLQDVEYDDITLKLLETLTAKQLMQIHHCGKKSIDELRDIMGRYGLCLADEK